MTFFSSSWSPEQTRCCSAHKHQISAFYFCVTHFHDAPLCFAHNGSTDAGAGRPGLVEDWWSCEQVSVDRGARPGMAKM